MRLLTYSGDGGTARAGVMLGDSIFDLAELLNLAETSTLSALQRWDIVEPLVVDASKNVERLRGFHKLEHVTLLAPLLYPSAIYCAAANYHDHVRAISKKFNLPAEPDPRDLNLSPFHFLKPARSAIAGPGEVVRLPGFSEQVDWELELVAVIGRKTKDVPAERALEYIAGYTIGNDISVRDMKYLKRNNVADSSPFKSDFISLKGFDQSCAIGPWIASVDEVGDPQKLSMKLWIDDELMQDSSTAEMIFSVAEQVSYLSERVTLWPGDLIMTGTPAGTGIERDRFLQPGQTIRMYIDRIGTMSNSIV
jgi:2-keto-4-pentenoate hydratase/2-oxohepta-3-ene-1,7-dioic acid hydratase in catechol pathway